MTNPRPARKKHRSTPLLISAVVLTLSGCGGALLNDYFTLDQTRVLVQYDEFNGTNESFWVAGYEEGFSPWAEVVAGHLVAYDWRQSLRSVEELSSSLEIRLSWATWISDNAPVVDNGDILDFRVGLDTGSANDDEFSPSGTAVEIKLDDAGTDSLRVVDDVANRGTPASVSSPSPGLLARSGELVIVFDTDSSPGRVRAEWYDEFGLLYLSLDHELPDDLPNRAHLLLQASGTGSFEPRVVDSLIVMRADTE